MKNYTINEITDNMVIHCETQEEYNRVWDLLPDTKFDFRREYVNGMICIYNDGDSSTVQRAVNHNLEIIPSTSVKSTEDSAVIETQANEAVEDPMTFSFDAPISKRETTGEELTAAIEAKNSNPYDKGQETYFAYSIAYCSGYASAETHAQSEISQLRERNRELVELLREYYIADCVPDTEDFLQKLNVRYEDLLSKHNNH